MSFSFLVLACLCLLASFPQSNNNTISVFTMAQELPMPVALPRFVNDPEGRITYRTNVCASQQRLFDNQILLRDALRGYNLTVAMTAYNVPNEDAFFTLDKTTGGIKENDPGLFVVMMDEIARRAGFEWRHSYAAIDPVSAAEKKTWTELLQWETHNFDIAADYWARSQERMKLGIAFPEGWYDGSIILATSTNVKDGSHNGGLWSFLLPFETAVWFAILAAIVLTGAMYLGLERLRPNSDEGDGELRPLGALFMATVTFTGHYHWRPNTHAARLLTFSWSFWALLTSSAYTANMASFLVSRNNIVFSVSTVEDAVTTGTPVCVQRGAVIDEILSAKHPDLQLIRKDTELEVFEALKLGWYGGQGGCGVVVTNLGTFEVYQSQASTNGDCSLTSEKRVVSELPAGFATAVDSGIMCTSLISHVLDLHLTEMKAEGFIDQAWQDHVTKLATVSCSDPALSGNADDDTYSLTAAEMGGIFIMHAVLSGVALAFALFRYFHTKWRQPEKQLRPLKLESFYLSTRTVTRPSPPSTPVPNSSFASRADRTERVVDFTEVGGPEALGYHSDEDELVIREVSAEQLSSTGSVGELSA